MSEKSCVLTYCVHSMLDGMVFWLRKRERKGDRYQKGGMKTLFYILFSIDLSRMRNVILTLLLSPFGLSSFRTCLKGRGGTELLDESWSRAIHDLIFWYWLLQRMHPIFISFHFYSITPFIILIHIIFIIHSSSFSLFDWGGVVVWSSDELYTIWKVRMEFDIG